MKPANRVRIFPLLVCLYSSTLWGCLGEKKPCTELAEVKALNAEVWANADTLEMETYTGLTDEYSGLRETVKRISRSVELSSLAEDSTESAVCTALAEEAIAQAEIDTELAESMYMLSENWADLIGETTELTKKHTRGREISANWAKFYQLMVEGRDPINYFDYFHSETPASMDETKHVLELRREISKQSDRFPYHDLWGIERYKRNVKVATRMVEEKGRLAQIYSKKVEEMEPFAYNTEVLARRLSEQAGAHIALSEAYTALSEENAKLSGVSIVLVAEAYTTLSMTYAELSVESEQYAAMSEAYTALAEGATALAEGWD